MQSEREPAGAGRGGGPKPGQPAREQERADDDPSPYRGIALHKMWMHKSSRGRFRTQRCLIRVELMEQRTSLSPQGRGGDNSAGPSAAYMTPRWLKVFGTVITVVILSFVILRFTVFSGH